MSRLTNWKCGAALLALLVAAPLSPAAPVPTGKTPLALVPEKTSLVLYLHGVEHTRDRFLTTLKASLPELAPDIEKKLNELLKDGVEGRKLTGLEKDGPVFLALLEMPHNFDKPPKAAFIVAVTDYAKFRDGLLDDDQKKGLKKLSDGIEEAPLSGGEKAYFLDRKGWAIVAADKEVIESFTKEYKGLDGRMSKEQAAKLLDSDFGLYMSMDAFNKDYAEQIAQAKKAVNDQLLPQLEAGGTVDKGTVEIYKKVIEIAFQAVEDSQGILLTVEFRPTGLALHVQSELRADSATHKALKAFQTSPMAELNRLPSGQAYYTAVKPTPEWIETIGPLLFSVQDDPKQVGEKAINTAIQKIVKAGPTETVNSVTVPLAGVQAIKYKDTAKAVEGQLDLMRALKANTALQGTVVKDKAVIKLKAQKYGDFEFHQIEVPLDLEKTLERSGIQQLPDDTKKAILDYYKKTIGDKVTTWLGTDGKAVVNVTAPDWKSAQKMLDAYFSGKGTLADSTAFREFRKELPAETTLFAAMDPVLYGSFLADNFKFGFEGAAMGMFKLPPNFPTKPEKHVPTYFGMAVTLKSQRGSLDVFFSAKGIHESFKAFGRPFMNNF